MAQDCPMWRGHAHRALADRRSVVGPDDSLTRFERFVETRNELQQRIEDLIATL
jgi:hypothetical protein